MVNPEVLETVLNYIEETKEYYKGAKIFKDKDLHMRFCKQIMENSGRKLVNICFTYVKNGSGVVTRNKHRNKILSKMTDEGMKLAFDKLQKTLDTTSVGELLANTTEALKHAKVNVQRLDMDRQSKILLAHKESLTMQLLETTDERLVLHSAVILLFQATTGCMLDSPLDLITEVIRLIKPNIPLEDFRGLYHYHDLMMKLEKDETQKEGISACLKELDHQMKAATLTFCDD